MIDSLITYLRARFPTELDEALRMLVLVAPWLLIVLGLVITAHLVERWIESSERRRIERARRRRYRTADDKQIAHDLQQLWSRWPDTIPPRDEGSRSGRRVRAGGNAGPTSGPATVVDLARHRTGARGPRPS